MPDTDDMPLIVLSDRAITLFRWIMLATVCQVIAVFGIGTNVVNIVCFVKQGFQDPVNVSFLGLAIADMFCLATLLWANLCYTPAFATLEVLPFDSVEISYLTSAIPHVTFSRITGWITAFITLERCMCIAAPLRTRNIITPNRVSFIVCSFYVILISTVAPEYVVNRLEMKHVPARNKTVLGLVFTANREKVERITFAVNNVGIPFTAFLVIIVCTVVLVVQLQSRIKWRMTSTSCTQAGNVLMRNRKVAKMVIMISSMFIVCFIPMSVCFTIMALDPRFSAGGQYVNVLVLLGGISIVLESMNSSVNIFFYYHMSSKYRIVFCHIFHIGS